MFKRIKSVIRNKIQLLDEHTALAVAAGKVHEKTFLPYKNYCKGEKSLVLCACGPSLQKYKPIKEAIHIGLNRAFLYDKVKFDFIFAQDYEGINMCQEQLINYRVGCCEKFIAYSTSISKKTIPETLALRCNAKRFYIDYIYGDGYKSKMVTDIENRAIGGMPNVGYSVLQLALYMNPSKIYLVGYDMSGNHFSKGNQTEEEEARQEKDMMKYWSDETEMKRLLDKWVEVKQFAKTYYPEIEIISVNPIGLKGMFKDIYQSEDGK